MLKFLHDTFELLYNREKGIFLALVAIPFLAVTKSAFESLVMGVIVVTIILCSMWIYRLLKSFIPWELHLLMQLMVTTLLVIALDIYLQNALPAARAKMGIYLPLMALLGFGLEGLTEDPFLTYVKNWFKVLACGLGYIGLMVAVGILREVFGSGTFFGKVLFEPGFTPQLLIGEAPGAFFILGLLLAGYRWLLFRHRRKIIRKEESAC